MTKEHVNLKKWQRKRDRNRKFTNTREEKIGKRKIVLKENEQKKNSDKKEESINSVPHTRTHCMKLIK